MLICGTPVRMEMALPRPITEPPPIETTQSAATELRKAVASSVTEVGVCGFTFRKVPDIVIDVAMMMSVTWMV